MTTDELKAALSRAVRKSWPKAAKASDLPYPDYWKSATEWLAFHAPHVGGRLMERLVADVVHEAVMAEAAGTEPKPYKVPDKVRQIWQETASVQQQGGRGLAMGRETASVQQQGGRWLAMERETAGVQQQSGRRLAMEQGRLL